MPAARHAALSDERSGPSRRASHAAYRHTRVADTWNTVLENTKAHVENQNEWADDYPTLKMRYAVMGHIHVPATPSVAPAIEIDKPFKEAKANNNSYAWASNCGQTPWYMMVRTAPPAPEGGSWARAPTTPRSYPFP